MASSAKQMQHLTWLPAPADLTLVSDEVHVWRAWLDRARPHLADLLYSLSADELARADRFRSEPDRLRYVAARGILRAILARYLGFAPHDLRFRYGPQGKPFLMDASQMDGIRFNLAHSDGLALYAIAQYREVGIDLERIRPMPDAEQIAASFFSPQEYTRLISLPRNQRLEAFFNCWTRKEALVKAVGNGLSAPLHVFDVTLVPDKPAVLLEHRKKPTEAQRWSLHHLVPGTDYVSALAVEGRCCRLQRWDWVAAT
ncbi:MAG: 4'-phosphopantetheinyl transferase family protein [Planctomycetota bacterium]|jgi:4'-phosphopantetheinyl transferase